MTTWEEIRDEVAGVLADGKPLEDVIAKLEKQKNEMAKANLLKAIDDMKKREQTNEDWLRTATTEQLAEWIFNLLLICSRCGDESQSDKEKIKKCPFGKIGCAKKDWVEWLKQPHQ